MGLVDRMKQWAQRALTLNDPALRALFKDLPTHSGITVTEHTATNFAAVWAAVRVISEDVATVPLFLYRRLDGGGKERAVDRRLYRLLHDEPNPEMSAVTFRETLTAHTLTWGNGYAEIERNGLNEPIALWPIPPDRVRPDRTRVEPQLIYRVMREDGREVILTTNQMLHIPGLSFDGVKGYSVIAKARESLGAAIAAERFGASFFGKGGRPGVVLEHPKALSDPAKDYIRKSWRDMFGGPEKSHEIAVLEEGMKLHDFGIPPEDMQFLQVRKFSVTEVARWFRVKPSKIADLERATFSNIEHEYIDHVVSTLRPWYVRWEQELSRKLIPSLERRLFFFEHLIDALLRGDAQARSAALQVQFMNGALSDDEWREIENRNPLPDGLGKTFFVPANMQTIERAKNPPEPPAPQPQPAPAPDDANDDDDRALVLVSEAIARIDALAEEVRTAVKSSAGNGQSALAAPAPEPADGDRRAAAHRDLFVDVIGRMVRREVKAVRKRLHRSTSREELLTWAAGYYAEHADLVSESIRSAVAAHLAEIGSDGSAADESKRLSDRYVAEALAQLQVSDDIEALLAGWEQERAGIVADAIIAEGGPAHAAR